MISRILHPMRFLFFLYVLIYLSSCCFPLAECFPVRILLPYLKIYAATDSTQYFFGATQKAKLKDLKMFSVRADDTTSYHIYGRANYWGDSIISIESKGDEIPVMPIYVLYPDGLLDSMEIIYRIESSRCCDDNIEIDHIVYNGSLLKQDTSRYYVIYR